jgi:hypothetical protein
MAVRPDRGRYRERKKEKAYAEGTENRNPGEEKRGWGVRA